MSNHARLSPSGSSRWLACPGSVNMTKDLINKSGETAYRGTVIHQAGEDLLLGKFLQPGTTVIVEQDDGSKKAEYIQKDMFEEAKAYSDYIRLIAKRDKNSEIIPEMKIDLTDLAPDTFGHSDAVVIENNTLHIADLKTGAGLVNSEGNSQLMIYAYGALLELEMFHDIHNIELHIIQNNSKTGGDKSNSHRLSVDELLTWVNDIVKPAAKEALSDEARCIPGDIQCKWCPAASFCPELMKNVEDIFDDLTDGHRGDLIAGGGKNLIARVDMDKAIEFYKSLSLIDIWKKAIESRMYEDLEAGKEVKGFKLVKKSKHKKWINEEEAFQKLKAWEKLDDIAPRKLITPTQASKLLGQMSTIKSNKFAKLWIKPEGELIVVKDSDKRPSESPVIDNFQDINNEL